MRYIGAIFLLLTLALSAQAQQTFPNYVNGLPPAGTVTGAEYFYMLQNGISTKVTGDLLVAPGSALAPSPTGPLFIHASVCHQYS